MELDIKSAFRRIIVHPANFDLLGIKFEGEFYIDKCLPMGCSLSCNLFEKCSTFLQWALSLNLGYTKLTIIWTISFLWVVSTRTIAGG